MKLLLTSGGVTNQSIENALIDLLGKPIEDSKALCITTASYVFPEGNILASRFLIGNGENKMCELGWKSIGLLELSVLNSIDKDIWLNALKSADVLLVNGGDPMFLSYWMETSGLAKELPHLDLVYVGMSAGSMILAERIGNCFVNWKHPSHTDKTLGIIHFGIFPHLNHPRFPENNIFFAEEWADDLNCLSYAIDDQTAIVINDKKIDIVSEGEWKIFNN